MAIPGEGLTLDDAALDRLIERIALLKVGGSYWAAQPALPDQAFILVRVDSDEANAELPRGDTPIIGWSSRPGSGDISGPCDPWHLVKGAQQVVTSATDELALVAAIAGVPVRCVGEGPHKRLESGRRADLRAALREAAVESVGYLNPFTGEPSDLASTVELCGFWRALIDGNRQLTAAVGFARWKRPTVAPLLWSGSPIPFATASARFGASDMVAVWKSRTPARAFARLADSSAAIVEVEDGFIRSAGLGADCVPPLSVVVDRSGIYFDPRSPSDLETILQRGRFDDSVLQRAKRLRAVIVESGISKYASAPNNIRPRASDRRQLLVPGQVEDDRSILSGGGSVRTNLDLLRRVRERAPDAYILYKPHPDVEAGHRIGSVSDESALRFADEVVRDAPISSLLDMVDEVHVNTSLAGFEALLRGKPVTAYGTPFFAGWGLTTDLGEIPARRTARRSLDELVAAALLIYPRYLDPLTGLPCPPEILIQRLASGGNAKSSGALVTLRRLQGQLKRVALALRAS